MTHLFPLRLRLLPLVVTVGLATSTFAPTAHGQSTPFDVPIILPYTGTLVRDGVPVTADVQMTLRLYSGATCTDCQLLSVTEKVRVRDGRFFFPLGRQGFRMLDPIFSAGGDLYLSIEADGVQLSGRQAIEKGLFAQWSAKSGPQKVSVLNPVDSSGVTILGNAGLRSVHLGEPGGTTFKQALSGRVGTNGVRIASKLTARWVFLGNSRAALGQSPAKVLNLEVSGLATVTGPRSPVRASQTSNGRFTVNAIHATRASCGRSAVTAVRFKKVADNVAALEVRCSN